MRRFGPGHPIQLALGLAVWSVWFVVVYAGVSLACMPAAAASSDGAQAPGVVVALLVFTAVTTGALALAAVWCWRGARARARAVGPATDEHRFVALCAAWLYGVAAASTAYVGLPMLVVPACV